MRTERRALEACHATSRVPRWPLTTSSSGELLMRLTAVLLLTLAMAITAPACSEEEAPASEAATPAEGEEKPAEGEEKKAEGEEKKAEGDDKEAPPSDEKKDEGEAKTADGDAPTEPAAEPVKPKVSEEECKAACEHITTLTMSSLPAETKEEAKAKIGQALKERCPPDCLKHGTPESMKCVMAAKTAVDLAACPK